MIGVELGGELWRESTHLGPTDTPFNISKNPRVQRNFRRFSSQLLHSLDKPISTILALTLSLAKTQSFLLGSFSMVRACL